MLLGNATEVRRTLSESDPAVKSGLMVESRAVLVPPTRTTIGVASESPTLKLPANASVPLLILTGSAALSIELGIAAIARDTIKAIYRGFL